MERFKMLPVKTKLVKSLSEIHTLAYSMYLNRKRQKETNG